MFVRLTLAALLTAGCVTVAGFGQEKKDEKQKDESRKGTVTGVVTAKGDNWIEVKADGEEKARRYVPHWKGGLPKDGGGPDKEMVAEIQKVAVNSRVKIDWEYEERARVVKIEVLKKPDEKKDAPGKEPRSGSISGEIKAMKEQNNNVVIDVLAPGEEKPRSYFVQWDPKLKAPMPDVLKLVKAAKAGPLARTSHRWRAASASRNSPSRSSSRARSSRISTRRAWSARSAG
jgi:hypothetical protein